ncbi:MAG TPA: thioredoxin domain-containing protein [Puia sp.]|nr:thioredoxin domain-containing protein [Puia sp.]
MPNRLAGETSPYLLQHAHNPVDWYPWGEEALWRAKQESKPILVSIGYSACHWCHVMERESFEDADTARFMNEHFINIKIDREERPDLDHIYMDAVQAITGSGGWPLNVFLTSDGRPFYGGTYFPPRPVYNRPSWMDVLAGVARSYRERKAEIEQQAGSLTRHVAGAGSWGVGGSSGAGQQAAQDPFNPGVLRQIRDQLLAIADRREGGFGGAPKFPQTFSIRYLLHYYYFTRDTEALDQACLSLDKMIAGGIFDQLGGGFARYSTDDEWLVPHFEKMLYDNALLVVVLSEAYQLTGRSVYREAIELTLSFVDRELSNGQGGFYSALDADSEGIEGKYYVWDKAGIDLLLGEDSQLFCACYGVTEEGNWEGRNILYRAKDLPADPGLASRLEAARARLLESRAGRVRPALDDKILLGWNALMNIAYCKAYAALGKEEYRRRAIANIQFLRTRFKGEGLHYYYHSYKGGARIPAFLDDYAFLIAALIELQEITGEGGYLMEARAILEEVIAHFSEEGGDGERTGFFYFTHDSQNDLILRKKEIYDGAIPSGNSVMAFNLLYLSMLFDQPAWADRSRQMAQAVLRVVTGYPGSFGIWATLYQALTYTIPEIVITASRPENARKELLSQLIPYRVFQSSSQEDTHFPLLRDKPVREMPQYFLCENHTCQLPVNELATLIRLLENVHKIPSNSYNNPI